MNQWCFPKKIRLLNLKEFILVFQHAKCIRINGMSLFNCPNQLEYPRLGLAISKKYIKCAHERNRIKRCARETFRMNQHNLSDLDFVLTVNSKSILYLKNDILIKEFEKLWHYYWN